MNAPVPAPFFSALTPADREAVIAIATTRKVRSGFFLGRAGTPVTEIFILVDGAAKVCRAVDSGKEVTIALLGPGAHIGVTSLLTNAQRVDDVVATCACHVLAIDASAFRALLQRSSTLSYHMLLSLAERLKQTSQHLADNALYALTQRLALRLFELAQVTDFGGEERLLIRQRPSHQELANMLGVSREAITRALHELEKGKHIRIDEDQIFVISTPQRS
jgi:CRP/FNR family cyclic AMP-dependent transcriptional regulator